jgi:pimeloyl-ACP methyl ester carboxylesterase
VPVTLVAGSRSAPVRQDATRALAALLPVARLVELDCGHFAQLERPTEVARAIAAV